MTTYLNKFVIALTAMLAMGALISSISRADDCRWASCYQNDYWYNYQADIMQRWEEGPYGYQAKGWAYPGPKVPDDAYENMSYQLDEEWGSNYYDEGAVDPSYLYLYLDCVPEGTDYFIKASYPSEVYWYSQDNPAYYAYCGGR